MAEIDHLSGIFLTFSCTMEHQLFQHLVEISLEKSLAAKYWQEPLSLSFVAHYIYVP